MKNLNLEVSLKPYYGLDEAEMRAACEAALDQWRGLVAQTGSVSIMFWVGDGSEILDYTGDLDAEFEWARFLGNANAHVHPTIASDPEGVSLHARSYLYREDAGLISYRRLATILRVWRAAIEGRGKRARVGLTFDPGGEFSPSTFKYERHREVCLADTMGKASFVCCYGVLDADQRAYAGFPQGIPQGTSLGTFLGRQFQCLAGDIGADFLWLSNGFGFGMETWMTVGPLFDGETFRPELAPETRDRILGFWRDFRRECPTLGVMTRGTNLGTATDLASDATPLRELYRGGFRFEPPPNSPWAALNGDFGLEIAGYMGRIVELPPGETILFRFYIHDPWWLNSPWLDRYERQPHDIYLPLAVSRIDETGRVGVAEKLSLLSLDDSYGRMPDEVPNEVTPHMLRAWSERPDEAGPLVWLYPFDEMHDTLSDEVPALERLFHVDWFAREALNDGVPLNTVISTRSWRAQGDRVHERLAGRIVVTPAPFDEAGEDLLLDWLEQGGRAMVYGPLTRAPRLRERLGLRVGAPLAGEAVVEDRLASLDRISGIRPRSFIHRPAVSAGGLSEVADMEPLVSARLAGGVRALASSWTSPGGGLLHWLRGPLPMRLTSQDHLPLSDDTLSTFPLSALVRQALAQYGWRIAIGAREHEQRHPVLGIHRHRNGWIFSGYLPDTTVELSLSTPFGQPLLLGAETWVDGDGCSSYRLARGWRHECRVFIDQKAGRVSCLEELPGQYGVARRCRVLGLKDATLRFFPPADAGRVTLLLNAQWPFVAGGTVPFDDRQTPHGRMLETTAPVTGVVILSW